MQNDIAQLERIKTDHSKMNVVTAKRSQDRLAFPQYIAIVFGINRVKFITKD